MCRGVNIKEKYVTRQRTWVAGLALIAVLASADPVAADESVRYGRVANTDSQNLRLRAAPHATAPIVKRLGPGWRISIIGNPTADGRWLKVEHAGAVGYVAVGYVALEDSNGTPPPAAPAPPPAAPAPPPAAPAPPPASGRPGQVVNTNGANLRLRAAPNATAAILKRLGPGWQVTVTGEAPNGWLKVEHGGAVGYVAAEFVAIAGAGGQPATPPAPPAPQGGRRLGWVTNTDGANLRIRSSADVTSEILKRLAPGWQVTIVEGPFNDAQGAAWVKIEHAGTIGYAAAAYVAGAAAGGGEAGPPPMTVNTPASPSNPAPAAPATSGRLAVTEISRLRGEPSTSATILHRLVAGSLVEPTGREVRADGYRWVSVRFNGTIGWLIADVLGPAPGPGTGQVLANEALSQTGKPYVWGGETPAGGFDCSGLTRYVVKKVTGIDISHVMADQVQTGSPVDRDSLQVGDMVFFKDTYKPGLSHVGFYIGDGQFVGAQNERVGVTTARLDTPYWRDRWYGARRME